jgi:type II secretory pathway pseudopilin PulG
MRAYTLFEILIVLVLLAVIMLLISIALDIHLRQMAINRTEIEEAQLARAVLEKIAQEIRSAVVASREETAAADSTGVHCHFLLFIPIFRLEETLNVFRQNVRFNVHPVAGFPAAECRCL